MENEDSFLIRCMIHLLTSGSKKGLLWPETIRLTVFLFLFFVFYYCCCFSALFSFVLCVCVFFFFFFFFFFLFCFFFFFFFLGGAVVVFDKSFTFNACFFIVSTQSLFFDGKMATVLPQLVFGTCGIIGSLLILTLPETRDAELPATVDDIRVNPRNSSKQTSSNDKATFA